MPRHQNSADESRSELPVWADRYARNRVLPFILLFVGVLIFSVVFTLGLSSLFLLLKRGGHPALVILSIVYNAAVVAVILWMTTTGRLSRIFQRFAEKLYRQEGSAVPTIPGRRAPQGHERYLVMGLAFAAPWVLYLVMLVFLQVLKVPPAYLQPAVATLIVPALIVLALVGPDKPRWLGLIAPTLYAMHAVLVLAGVRLSVFSFSDLAGGDQLLPTGQQIFDVWMPLFVYGMLGFLVRHIYSRYALLRLRIAALSPAPQFMEAEEKGDDDGDA